MQHTKDRALRDSEQPRDRVHSHQTLPQLADANDVCIGELAPANSLAVRSNVARLTSIMSIAGVNDYRASDVPSSFLDHVAHVVGVRPCEKVFWANAASVVASVTDESLIWNRAIREEERDSVR